MISTAITLVPTLICDSTLSITDLGSMTDRVLAISKSSVYSLNSNHGKKHVCPSAVPC